MILQGTDAIDSCQSPGAGVILAGGDTTTVVGGNRVTPLVGRDRLLECSR